MHFETLKEWQHIDPIMDMFNDPEHPSYNWRAVRLPLNIYYYHVWVKPQEEPGMWSNLLLGSITDALQILNEMPGSYLLLQVPDWLNKLNKGDNKPGLFTVEAIHRPEDQDAQLYIAEVAPDRYFVLDFDISSSNIDPVTVKKRLIWSASGREMSEGGC